MRASTLLLAALVTVSACKKKEEEGEKKAPPAPVKVALVTAKAADVPKLLVLTGTVVANQRSEVTADTQGKVLNVFVERGKRVKQGEPVVQLDVVNAQLGAREAAANLAAARAQRQNADDECKRTKDLLDKGAITRSDYDKQNTACTSAQQQVAAAQARAEMMSKTANDGLVRAPFSGLVDSKNVSPGEWVAPGRALFTLVDDDPLRIELSVPEAAIGWVKKDQRVELSVVSHPGQTYGATVTRIGAEVGKTRSLIIEATIDKGSDLVPGMFAEAHLQIGTVKLPVIPKTAVVQKGKTWHAFVDKKGELEERIVQLGAPPGPDQVSILNNVANDEKVVAKPDDKTVDGLRIVE